MMQCKNCGFQVNELMKFSLMQNLCPSCGKGLFSDADSNIISTFQSRISSERFASRLTDELIYDLALFMFNEFKHGIGKTLKLEINPEEDLEEIEIRREIEAEYSDELQFLEDEDISSEQTTDIIEKTEKLKKLHQQRLMQSKANEHIPEKRTGFGPKQGQRVSRIS